MYICLLLASIENVFLFYHFYLWCLKQLDASLDYQGFVRVHMCVTRPIHVSAGITRNSWYGLMKPVEHHHNKSSANDSGIDSAIEVSYDVCYLVYGL